MGESVVDASNFENKMGEPSMDVGALQVSVSFGRFESDSLRWEKWSAFPTNKYLEEVGKCSTPGSVAQKKAYFESHYKKIAARKAEQLDQEKNQSTDLVDLEEQAQTDSVENTSLEKLDVEKSSSLASVTAVELENGVTNLTNEMNSVAIQDYVNGVELDNQVIDLTSEVSSSLIDEPKNNADIAHETETSLPPIVDAKDELCRIMVSSKSDKHKEVVSVRDASSVGSQEEQELPKKIDDGRDHALKENEEKVKLEGPKKSPKVTTPKKATNITTAKKKPAFPRPKSPLISTPKSSKPALSGTIMSTTTHLTAEKRNNFSPLTARKTTSAESKKAAPAYLHMSLCLGPASSDPGSLAITRKSLIMERMGDKDIVRRAFKTFQNNFSELLSSSSGKSSATKQFSRKEAERKRWVSETPMRKNEGMDKAVKNTSAPHGNQGMRKASTSLELPKIAGVEKGNGTTVLSSFGMKNHYMPSKQKRSSKMPEEISKANETGRTLNQSKTKVEKELEIKKLQNCHNFKAKPMPGSYQGTGKTKSAVHKNNAKTDAYG